MQLASASALCGKSTGHSQLTYSRSSPRPWRTVTLAGKLHPLIYQRIRRAPFLAQERIPLAEYRGVPLTSGSPQAGLGNRGAVPKPRRLKPLSPTSRGSAYQVPDILTRDAECPYRRNPRGSANFPAYRPHPVPLPFIPYVADFDWTSDRRWKALLIECNGRDQRYGFGGWHGRGMWKNLVSESGFCPPSLR